MSMLAEAIREEVQSRSEKKKVANIFAMTTWQQIRTGWYTFHGEKGIAVTIQDGGVNPKYGIDVHQNGIWQFSCEQCLNGVMFTTKNRDQGLFYSEAEDYQNIVGVAINLMADLLTAK